MYVGIVEHFDEIMNRLNVFRKDQCRPSFRTAGLVIFENFLVESESISPNELNLFGTWGGRRSSRNASDSFLAGRYEGCFDYHRVRRVIADTRLL